LTVVHRIPLVVLEIKIEGVTEAVICLIHSLVTDRRLAFRADELPGVGLPVSSGIDDPLDLRGAGR